MPLSELLANSTVKSNSSAYRSSSTMNNSSTPFYFSDNEFGELLWENGQIAFSKRFPLQDTITSTSTSSIVFSNNRGKNASDSPANGFLATQEEEEEEDMVPWIQYPLDSPPLRSSPFRHADFCSEFLDEFAGTNTTSLNFATPQPTTTGTGTRTGTGTELREEGEPSGLVNFSLFKTSRLRNGGKRDEHVLASSSTCRSELRNVPPEIPSICASEKERNGNNKRDEPILASSSVCSENSEGFENGGKRKNREGEESSSNSEAELEDESGGGGKRVRIGRGASVKKSRAAEVHNLSERRRRERINEKMKALQELIPNCSKADKASMLDDAIEYLKTLQLQVQMMSMGSGMYMPPQPVMMLPTMQLVRAPPMPQQFIPGMGMYHMGMGMGMGMGMYPPLPIPQQFIPGPPAMHGMVAPTLFHPPVPAPPPVDPIRPNKVGSLGQDANPATPDPKAETL